MIDIDYGGTTYFRTFYGDFISVRLDADAENPRTYHDQIDTFLTWGRRFQSPDENKYKTPEEFIEDVLGGEAAERCETMRDALSALNDAGYVAQGIYRLDHSGVSYALGDGDPFNDPWDSALVGFAYMTPETLAERGMDRERALKCMNSSMEEYSAWAEGNAFRVVEYDMRGEESDLCTVYGLDSLEAMYPHIKPFDIGDFADLESFVAFQEQERGAAWFDKLQEEKANGDGMMTVNVPVVLSMREGAEFRVPASLKSMEEISEYISRNFDDVPLPKEAPRSFAAEFDSKYLRSFNPDLAKALEAGDERGQGIADLEAKGRLLEDEIESRRLDAYYADSWEQLGQIHKDIDSLEESLRLLRTQIAESHFGQEHSTTVAEKGADLESTRREMRDGQGGQEPPEAGHDLPGDVLE